MLGLFDWFNSITGRNLLKSDGQYFTAIINGIHDFKVAGRIRVADNKAYLCQQGVEGGSPSDGLLYGFKFGWYVGDGGKESLRMAHVSDLKVISRTEYYSMDHSDYYEDQSQYDHEVPELDSKEEISPLGMIAGYPVYPTDTPDLYSFGCGEVKLTRDEIANYLKVGKTLEDQENKEWTDYAKVAAIVSSRIDPSSGSLSKEQLEKVKEIFNL